MELVGEITDTEKKKTSARLLLSYVCLKGNFLAFHTNRCDTHRKKLSNFPIMFRHFLCVCGEIERVMNPSYMIVIVDAA